jgi:hypothetical protein
MAGPSSKIGGFAGRMRRLASRAPLSRRVPKRPAKPSGAPTRGRLEKRNCSHNLLIGNWA